MIQQFKKIAAPFNGNKRFFVYDMSSGLDFNTVGDSILEMIDQQLKTTDAYLNNPYSRSTRCIMLY